MDELKHNNSFNDAFGFWVNNLFERINRLFTWTNTGDDLHGGIDPVHIEKPLLIDGHVGICEYKNKLTAFHGSYSGVSVYYDRFPDFMVRSPLYSGRKTIGKDIAIIRNNSTETSLLPLVKRYAVMLAHAEVTLCVLLVNARVTSVPTALTTKQKTMLDAWRNGVYNGKVTPILDSGFTSVKWVDINTNSNINIKDLVEVRENILCSFYHDIGVKTTIEKKGNLINAEINANDSMLLLNINDMLDARKRGCEAVNELFGANWSVDKCEELKYNENVNVDYGDDNGKVHN